MVTEPVHPYISAWWPAGHTLGYEHGFVHQARDFIDSISHGVQPRPSFDDGLQVQRVLEAVETSAVTGSAWTSTTSA
jgi:predicted dehydrogenase